MNALRALVAGLCLGLFPPAFALSSAPQQPETAQPVERLAHDAGWLALLHYRVRGGGVESEADRPGFFLSAEGKHSPRAELLAALAALGSPERRRDFACRFPARYEWLRTRLGQAGADALDEDCPQLASWFAAFPGRRISIHFASSYLESPSSTFGHTFLKVYQSSPSDLLSPTINYAARTDAREGDLAFVYKGLFGGFPGVADELPFYRRLRTYTEIEGRDVHEYALTLDPDEVRRLLLHTWEIKDGVFDYYFIRENCAYRTLSLIDVARPEAHLLAPFTAATVPVDTIRALRSAGMLGAHRIWPSLPKQVRGLEAQVPAQDADAAGRLARGRADSEAFAALPPARRAAILQLAYEYGAVLIDRDEGERLGRKETLGAIARARLGLDTPEPLASRAAAADPEDGHDGALLGVGLRRVDGGNGLALEYAAFQHTLTDPLPGYEPHAEISVLHPELDAVRGHIRLRRLDWLVTQSTIPSSTLFSPRAWRLELVTASKPFADRAHMATSAAYHSGQAWDVGGNTVLAILAGASVEASSGLAHRMALAGVLRTSLTRQGTRWSAQLEAVTERFAVGSALRRQALHATGEFRLSRNLSLAVAASRRAGPGRERALLVGLKWRQR